jgi:hypothetical protein
MKRRRTRRRTRRRNGPNTALWVGFGVTALATAWGAYRGYQEALANPYQPGNLNILYVTPAHGAIFGAFVGGGVGALVAGVGGLLAGGPEKAETYLAAGGLAAVPVAAALMMGMSTADTAAASSANANAPTPTTAVNGWPQLRSVGGVNA